MRWDSYIGSYMQNVCMHTGTMKNKRPLTCFSNGTDYIIHGLLMVMSEDMHTHTFTHNYGKVKVGDVINGKHYLYKVHTHTCNAHASNIHL